MRGWHGGGKGNIFELTIEVISKSQKTINRGEQTMIITLEAILNQNAANSSTSLIKIIVVCPKHNQLSTKGQINIKIPAAAPNHNKLPTRVEEGGNINITNEANPK